MQKKYSEVKVTEPSVSHNSTTIDIKVRGKSIWRISFSEQNYTLNITASGIGLDTTSEKGTFATGTIFVVPVSSNQVGIARQVRPYQKTQHEDSPKKV